MHQYKHRNLVDRLFCRLKQFRRVAARYDKLERRFESFAHRSAGCLFDRCGWTALNRALAQLLAVGWLSPVWTRRRWRKPTRATR